MVPMPFTQDEIDRLGVSEEFLQEFFRTILRYLTHEYGFGGPPQVQNDSSCYCAGV